MSLCTEKIFGQESDQKVPEKKDWAALNLTNDGHRFHGPTTAYVTCSACYQASFVGVLVRKSSACGLPDFAGMQVQKHCKYMCLEHIVESLLKELSEISRHLQAKMLLIHVDSVTPA